jgi:hypothetical protein
VSSIVTAYPGRHSIQLRLWFAASSSYVGVRHLSEVLDEATAP